MPGFPKRSSIAALLIALGAIVTSGDAKASDVELEAKWHGLSTGCSYLAPKDGFVHDGGGVDVVFHFHAGQMSEKQFRESGANAVFVSCGFGLGTGPYADHFADTGRFGRMTDLLVSELEKSTHKEGLHVRRIALASWSAGFAAIGKILAVDRYYDMVDSVVLMDSLHSQYKDPNPRTAAQGVDRVDVLGLRTFIRFAKDAADGKKAMIMTHSSIIPPDYASSTEATQALLTEIGVPLVETAETNARGMTLFYKADAGNLHVRGFKGRGPKDHFAHLYLIGELLESWVVPRWKPEDRIVYTLAGE